MDKKEILVIDDDPDIRYMLKKQLESGGYHCTCVTETKLALESLQSLKPDLVIVDLGLPHADGTAFITSIEEWLPQGSKIPPMIVLSGHNEQEVVNYCLEHGARGFLAKPHDPDVLLTMVHDYIQ